MDTKRKRFLNCIDTNHQPRQSVILGRLHGSLPAHIPKFVTQHYRGLHSDAILDFTSQHTCAVALSKPRDSQLTACWLAPVRQSRRTMPHDRREGVFVQDPLSAAALFKARQVGWKKNNFRIVPAFISAGKDREKVIKRPRLTRNLESVLRWRHRGPAKPVSKGTVWFRWMTDWLWTDCTVGTARKCRSRQVWK